MRRDFGVESKGNEAARHGGNEQKGFDKLNLTWQGDKIEDLKNISLQNLHLRHYSLHNL